MKVIITTDRLNTQRQGDILEYGKDAPITCKLNALLNNGEAEFIKEEVEEKTIEVKGVKKEEVKKAKKSKK